MRALRGKRVVGRYEFVNVGDVFDDDNNGLKYGIADADEPSDYAEWFKSSRERANYARKNRMKVINK